MTTWIPDTCDCIIDIENKKMLNHCCKEHKSINECIKHNQLFNYRYGKEIKLTQTQQDDLKLGKNQEKMELRKGDKKVSLNNNDVDERIIKAKKYKVIREKKIN
tara:strand:+ start:385 stop:696 length:312 start_codon:yes stop_codon:yes gene_type:complete